MRKLPCITEVEDVKGKYVVVRSSLNVPIDGAVVRNQFRIVRSLPTILWLAKAGARVILLSHIANSKETEKDETLQPVYEVLKNHCDIVFSNEVATPKTKELRDSLTDGQVLLVENVRRDPREKKNDADFARSLADLGDLYVNDDFAASHREHASLSGIPQFLPSYFGINFVNEYNALSTALEPKSPSLFILGGAKFDTKMPLVEKFLSLYDHVCIAGALANDIYKARGYEVGRSLVSEIDLSQSALLTHEKVIVPSDVVVANDAGEKRTVLASDVTPQDTIMDAGPETIHMLELFIRNAKTVLWNGPLGNYEAGFDAQTAALARLIGDEDTTSVVGGGDTTAVIEGLGFQDKYTFLSTAGGAMLTFLELGTLPGIEAIMDKR